MTAIAALVFAAGRFEPVVQHQADDGQSAQQSEDAPGANMMKSMNVTMP